MRSKMLLLALFLTFLNYGCAVFSGADLDYMRSLPMPEYNSTYEEASYEARLDVLHDAAKLAFEEAGLEILEDRSVDDNTVQLIAHHSHEVTSGQHIRIVLMANRQEKAVNTKLFYSSAKDFDQNVMADLWSMKKKIMLFIDDYVELYAMEQ